MPDYSVNLAGLRLRNPVILASGIMGSDLASLRKVASAGAGAVTTKSITLMPRKGHDNPTLVEVEGGFLNCIGYSNMGLENAKSEYLKVPDLPVPAILSVVAEDSAGFAKMAGELAPLGFSAVEAVLSCPHTPGYGLLAGHGTPEATYDITRAVKEAVKVPVFVKLSPNTPCLGEISKAAASAGADAINMGNSLGPGMVIDTGFAKPVLSYSVGGMSGKAIKPIAVRCVWDVWEATGGKTPIIGTGGVTTGLDAVEMMLAGASAVGVGTAVHYRGLGVFRDIPSEIKSYMGERGIGSLKELVGAAHG